LPSARDTATLVPRVVQGGRVSFWRACMRFARARVLALDLANQEVDKKLPPSPLL